MSGPFLIIIFKVFFKKNQPSLSDNKPLSPFHIYLTKKHYFFLFPPSEREQVRGERRPGRLPLPGGGGRPLSPDGPGAGGDRVGPGHVLVPVHRDRVPLGLRHREREAEVAGGAQVRTLGSLQVS